MKTTNIRLAAYLLVKGHTVRGIGIDPATSFGVVSFDDAVEPDAAAFAEGAQAPADQLLATYRTLIRQIDEVRRLGGGR